MKSKVEKSELIGFIENIKKLGISPSQEAYYDFIIENGKLFTEREKLETSVKAEMKACYRNSALVHFTDKIDYYEGYCISDIIPIPIEHAFNSRNDSDKVIDITAQKFNFSFVEYFGAKVPKEVMKDWLKSSQYLTPLQFYFRKHAIMPTCFHTFVKKLA